MVRGRDRDGKWIAKDCIRLVDSNVVLPPIRRPLGTPISRSAPNASVAATQTRICAPGGLRAVADGPKCALDGADLEIGVARGAPAPLARLFSNRQQRLEVRRFRFPMDHGDLNLLEARLAQQSHDLYLRESEPHVGVQLPRLFQTVLL